MARIKAPELQRALSAISREGRFVIVLTLLLNVLLLTTSIYMWEVFDRVFSSGSLETLAYLTIVALAALAAYGALEAARRRVLTRAGVWLESEIGPRALDASVRAKLHGATIGGQSLRDLSELKKFLSGDALTVFLDAPTFPIFAALIWMLHPALGMFAAAGALALVTCAYLNDRATQKTLASASTGAESAQQTADHVIANAEVVRAMGLLPDATRMWQESDAESRVAQLSAGDANTFWSSLAKTLRFALQVGVLGLGASFVLAGTMSAGGMIAASILLGRALSPAERAIGSWRGLRAALASLARLDRVLAALPPEAERLEMPEPVGALAVENLRHTPPGAQAPALVQVSFQLDAGESCAIIGPSGSGKSTLCRALVGVARPEAGEIRLDGTRLDHWPIEQLGPRVGYAPPDAGLFGGTVAANIARLGEPDPEKVIAAAQRAGAHDVINQMANGYDTDIGPGGSRLSGGQRQRVALARALYGDPRLVVLDEPDAHLDDDGRQSLNTAFAALKERGVTLVFVTHSPALARLADKVLVLDSGRSAAFGPALQIIQSLAQRAGAKPAAAAAAGGDAKPRIVTFSGPQPAATTKSSGHGDA